MRESLAAIARGCCFAALLLMQCGFMPTQDSCSPCNALRVADRQLLGLLVGFYCVLGTVAARVLLTGVACSAQSRQRRAPLVLHVGRTFLWKERRRLRAVQLASVFTGR